MFFGTGTTSSVIPRGAPGRPKALPNSLVVLVNTQLRTARPGGLLEKVQRAGDVGVDELLARVRGHMGLVERRCRQQHVEAAMQLARTRDPRLNDLW